MRITVFGFMRLLFDMLFLVDQVKHITSHNRVTEDKPLVADLLDDYVRHKQRSREEMDVSPHPSADGFSAAYLFHGGNRSVEVSRNLLRSIGQRLVETSNSFTIVAALRQQTNNVGSIVSLGTENQRLLEIESSGWRRELRFHFAHRSRTRTESFSYDLADNEWHHLALSVTGGTNVNVFVDCKLAFERRIPKLDDLDLTRLNDTDTRLWIGQRNTRHVYFKGAIEYVKIVYSPEGYLEQCPSANVACPSCHQFQQLQQSVQQLQSLVTELTKQITNANQRIGQLEECECRKQCRMEGETYRDGETVPSKESSTTCKCQAGLVFCRKKTCSECENPLIPDGECCPTRLKHCQINGNRYEHDDEFSPKPCVKCACKNGKIECQRIQRKSCPRPRCPKSKQVEIDGCCKVCRGADFCSSAGDRCQANSTCINLETMSACQCNQGFVAVGKTCQDVDECQSYGGLHGHHCHGNAECVNTMGSYSCKCAPGYRQIDQYTCQEMDMCEVEGRNTCHLNSDCVSVTGSFVCRCREGYEGDGINCSPVCSDPCHNGGHCVDVGMCRCRHGYMGKTCDIDIDECSDGVASCHVNSVCVNVPGSYRCRCRDGYHSNRPDNDRGSLCRDLDECDGWGGGHRCPASSVCRNTDGGYECICPENVNCSPGCNFDGQTFNSGDIWQPKNEPCNTCLCQNGSVECEQKFYECHTEDELRNERCCVGSRVCRHQNLPLTYQSGETWRCQCDTCQCHDGETDCWPTVCPKLDCHQVIHDDGECCPRCPYPDPCGLELESQRKSHLGTASCTFNGRSVASNHSWILDSDQCSSCQCLDGVVCCSYNQLCVNGSYHQTHRRHHPPNISMHDSKSHRDNDDNEQDVDSADERRHQQRHRHEPSTLTTTTRQRTRTRHDERKAEDNG